MRALPGALGAPGVLVGVDVSCVVCVLGAPGALVSVDVPCVVCVPGAPGALVGLGRSKGLRRFWTAAK